MEGVGVREGVGVDVTVLEPTRRRRGMELAAVVDEADRLERGAGVALPEETALRSFSRYLKLNASFDVEDVPLPVALPTLTVLVQCAVTGTSIHTVKFDGQGTRHQTDGRHPPNRTVHP